MLIGASNKNPAEAGSWGAGRDSNGSANLALRAKHVAVDAVLLAAAAESGVGGHRQEGRQGQKCAGDQRVGQRLGELDLLGIVVVLFEFQSGLHAEAGADQVGAGGDQVRGALGLVVEVASHVIELDGQSRIRADEEESGAASRVGESGKNTSFLHESLREMSHGRGPALRERLAPERGAEKGMSGKADERREPKELEEKEAGSIIGAMEREEIDEVIERVRQALRAGASGSSWMGAEGALIQGARWRRAAELLMEAQEGDPIKAMRMARRALEEPEGSLAEEERVGIGLLAARWDQEGRSRDELLDLAGALAPKLVIRGQDLGEESWSQLWKIAARSGLSPATSLEWLRIASRSIDQEDRRAGKSRARVARATMFSRCADASLEGWETGEPRLDERSCPALEGLMIWAQETPLEANQRVSQRDRLMMLSVMVGSQELAERALTLLKRKGERASWTLEELSRPRMSARLRWWSRNAAREQASREVSLAEAALLQGKIRVAERLEALGERLDQAWAMDLARSAAEEGNQAGHEAIAAMEKEQLERQASAGAAAERSGRL